MPDIISIFVNFKVTHNDAVLFPVVIVQNGFLCVDLPKALTGWNKNALNATLNETIQTFQKSVYNSLQS